MKKHYFFIGFILFGFLTAAWAVDVKIQVDLNNADDLYQDGGVWIMMDNDWTEWYDMADEDLDGIYEYTVTKDAGEIVYYKFSYQTGSDPDNDYVVEVVPDDCSAENGLRMVVVPDANTTLPAVVYESCYTAGITMRVDLSERTDVFEGGAVWVYMDDNWEEYYDMMPEGGDIYYYTLQPGKAALQYSFSYQNGADPDNDYAVETVPAECANENGYRFIELPAGDSTLPAFLFGSCSEASGIEVPKYNATFRVDMRDPIIVDQYPDGAVWLNINNWTDWYAMTDGDGDKIYTYEMEVDSGATILYKYSYQYGPNPDNDYMDEPVPAECASSSSEWDREYTPSKDSILPAVLMGACGEFGDTGTEKFSVMFNVILGGDSVSTNGMWMVTKNPWSWRQLVNVTEDVYSKSLKLYKDQTIPYTYVYGGQDNWEGEESVPPECNFGTEDAPERLFEGTTVDTIIPPVPFGQCSGGSPPVKVTYQVDMNEESMNDGDKVWLHIEEGDQWPEMSDDDNDGIFSVIVNQVPGSVVKYHFSFGTDAIWEDETVPSECSEDNKWRKHTVGDADETLNSVIYGKCGYTSISEFGSVFVIYPNPANDFLTIDMIDSYIDAQLNIADITGRVVLSTQSDGQSKVLISVRDLSPGMYFLQINSGQDSYSRKVLISE